MMNYDAEYDNRVRVPGYADIFARWRRQAADYRVACRSAEVGLSYGSSPRQTLDIFPALNRAADPPVALFIHGGWWRSLEPETFSHMAMGPNANCVTVAVAGYDLVPQVSIGDIVTQMRAACLHLWRRYRKRIAVYGHSAGGHLSACMIATDWTLLDPSVPRDLVHSAYSISGVFDLRPVMHTSMNTDFKLDDHSALALSPIPGNRRAAQYSTQWSGRWNPASFYGRAKLSWTHGPRSRKCVTMKSLGPIISRFSMLSPTRQAG